MRETLRWPRFSLFTLYLTCLVCFLCEAQASSLLQRPYVRRQTYDTDVVHLDANAESHKVDFYKFVTRPDIDAPRWDVTYYNKDALSPGYWFQATYEMVLQEEGDSRAWIGPYIYDQEGKLIWSGAPLFKGFNVKDFRVNNVNGEDMMTGMYAHKGEAVVVNNKYELQHEVKIGEGRSILNIHGFNTVCNGTRALAMTQRSGYASKAESKAIGYNGGRCHLLFPGFEEFDTSNWQRTFTWSAQNHILLNESFTNHNCKNKWDYLHANSIDKFPDGDYLYSGRHSDTLYKISGKDGSIVWRLHGRGKWSDFELSGHFSGQHDARVRSQNDTHTIISLMDNAIRPGEPHTTNEQSRGMILSLRTNTKPMTADVLQTYNHPNGEYAPGRGNMQILDNGNVFAAWWNHSLQSEYTSDGQLLMQARWKAELRSYRSYKFPWVGRPTQPPDVHSEAVVLSDEDGKESVSTVAFVSWNGATEVKSWNMYKTTSDGESRELVASVQRQDFETILTYEGFASYVIVEGLDANVDALGESKVVQTISPKNMLGADILEEAYWIEVHTGSSKDPDHWISKASSFCSNAFVTYLFGILTCAIVLIPLGAYLQLRRRKK